MQGWFIAFTTAIRQLLCASESAHVSLGLKRCRPCLLQVIGPLMPSPDHLQGIAEAMTSEHVLSGSRQATAQTVAAAIACNMPVLLEGPAAVGKTSLVTTLARSMPCRPVLERVNNTESTGLQVGKTPVVSAAREIMFPFLQRAVIVSVLPD